MQAKLEQCRDLLRSIPTEDGVRLEAMAVFREFLSEVERLRVGIHLLGPRELQVFELIGCGLAVKEIATQIGIGRRTVETYRDLCRAKLRVQNSHDLYFLAFRWMQVKMEQATQESTIDGQIPRATPPQHSRASPNPVSPLPSS